MHIENDYLAALKDVALLAIAISFGFGLIYLHLAVYEYGNLRLVGGYLLSIYGCFVGWNVFEYIIKRRRS